MSQSNTRQLSVRFALSAMASLSLLANPPKPETATPSPAPPEVSSPTQSTSSSSGPGLSSPFSAASARLLSPSPTLSVSSTGSLGFSTFSASSSSSSSSSSSASSASALARALGYSHSWPELEAAYRADMANVVYPMYLDVAEGKILAQLLHIGAEIYQLAPGQSGNGARQIVHRATLNEKDLSEESALRLLCHGRHYLLLEPAEDEESSYFEKLGEGLPHDHYRETGVPKEGHPEQIQPVPADGNCLITGMFFMATERFPTPDEVLAYRNLLATKLRPQQIREAVEEMILDLLENASEREWADGRFPTWGPNLSALLLDNAEFMRHYHRARASVRDEQMAIETQILSSQPRHASGVQLRAPKAEPAMAAAAAAASSSAQPGTYPRHGSPVPMTDEDAELEAAIRASLASHSRSHER